MSTIREMVNASCESFFIHKAPSLVNHRKKQQFPFLYPEIAAFLYKINIPAIPHKIPNPTTAPLTKKSTFLGKDLATRRSDGKLIAGSVIRSAAAGPPPRPNAMKVWIIGISAAVGITNSMPPIANKIMRIHVLAAVKSICGNKNPRTAPMSRTDTI